MTEDWEKLGQEVRTRRTELGYTQTDVQAAGGPSTALLRGIENATSKTLSRSKRRDLEQVLRWPRGHIDSILAGHPTQGSLLDVGAPAPPTIRPVEFDAWVVRHDESSSDRALVLDALSALESATNAIRGSTIDLPRATDALGRAQHSLVQLLQRSFTPEERHGLRVLPGPASLLDEHVEQRGVANEDQTLEQISEEQQQEP